jgi:hypothetical protein
MASNLFSPVSNYSGRQPDSVQNIKQFVTSFNSNAILWIYKKIIDGSTIIKTINAKFNVLIESNLTVLGSINNPSDINLKKNITELTTHDNNLLSLVPVTFEFKNDMNEKKHYGFIAQEVEKIYPELVSQEGSIKTLNYIEFIPIILSKMKEMQNEINELKKTISTKNEIIDNI